MTAGWKWVRVYGEFDERGRLMSSGLNLLFHRSGDNVIDPSNLDPAMVERAAEAIAKSRGEEFDEYITDWMDDARAALVDALTVEGGGG